MADIELQPYRPNQCCGRVLVVGNDTSIGSGTFAPLRTYYEDTMFLAVDYFDSVRDSPDFALNDYGLIFIMLPESVPTFWSTITSGDWNPCVGPRRVCVCGEYRTFTDVGLWQSSFDTIAGWAGLSVTPTDQDCCCTDARVNPALPHHLTDGITRLHMACTSKINNGTPISTTVIGGPFEGCSAPDPPTEGPGDVWIAGATKDGVDVIASGDCSHLIGSCTQNTRFIRNLWAVKTP